IAGVGWGAVQMRRLAAHSPLSRALMVGGLGAFVAGLGQTRGDWIHLLPGLPATARAAAAVRVWPRSRPRVAETNVRPSRLRRTLVRRWALVAGGSVVMVTLIVA